MKKFLLMGVLALSVAVLSQQQASAWINFRTGACINLGFQSGGNNWLWGAYRNGQPPAGVGCPAPYGHSEFGFDPNAPAPSAPLPRPAGDTQTWNYSQSPFQPASYRAPVYYPMPSYYYGYGR